MTPTCLGPDPNPIAPRFEVPRGATDCHAHIFGDPARYPFVPERTYTPPPPAPLEAYLAMHRALGIERAVIVTPSVHGTDNRVTLDAIAGYGPTARGVAVVDETIRDRDLADLHDGGIRGVRLNVMSGGGVGLHALKPLAERTADMGWQVQLFIDVGRDLIGIAPLIRELGVAVVIDHLGFMAVSEGLENPGFQTLLSLVRDGICWVKLSGNYRISKDPPHYSDAIPFARALIEASPDHMVWGTDWPHPELTENMPNDGDLLNALDDYTPDPDLKHRILVDNPATLYGLE